jgi:FtsP/CotA-like multicopper oxidase with cupredoxin domain
VPGLPQGDYDIPLALAAKRYNADGTLWDPDVNGETTSLYGDVIHVNGAPWPYMAVEPRKYRFRFLNAAISRSFQMYFEDPAGKRVNFNVVGSDAGLLTRPVQSNQLDISMAERWEVVFDFSQFAGKNVTLRNMRDVGADEDYNSTDKVMRECLAAACRPHRVTNFKSRFCCWEDGHVSSKERSTPFDLADSAISSFQDRS